MLGVTRLRIADQIIEQLSKVRLVWGICGLSGSVL
jgi:hypothetical protein